MLGCVTFSTFITAADRHTAATSSLIKTDGYCQARPLYLSLRFFSCTQYKESVFCHTQGKPDPGPLHWNCDAESPHIVKFCVASLVSPIFDLPPQDILTSQIVVDGV